MHPTELLFTTLFSLMLIEEFFELFRFWTRRRTHE